MMVARGSARVTLGCSRGAPASTSGTRVRRVAVVRSGEKVPSRRSRARAASLGHGTTTCRSAGRDGVRVLSVETAVEVKEEETAAERPTASTGGEIPGDPYEDEPWSKMKWTVYRGKAYDLTKFMSKHPGGQWLLNLAVKRDSTALFESYHLRPEVAVKRLKMLPEIKEFPVSSVPVAPYPNDSEFYNAVRERVRKEVFKGQEIKGAHRSGSEWAAVFIVGYAFCSFAMYVAMPNALTGVLCGLGGAWLGLTVQHCGNHGAMSTKEWVNQFLGLMDDLSGGSSLMWRYHHQVSHHVHCNDEEVDEDVFSSYPVLRFDHRLPRKWFHRFQHIYMWAMYPFLQLVFQFGDIKGLIEGRTEGCNTYGASTNEKISVVLGKAVHYTLIYALPLIFHGWRTMLVSSFCYVAVQSIVLATTFAVSHNVPEAKGGVPQTFAGHRLNESRDVRDWGIQQLVTSANWGGVFGCFMTGGLNLQIEHHLFPAVSFMHYPAISKIVEDEAKKRGLEYASYRTLTEILPRYVKFMRDVGRADDVPVEEGGVTEEMIEERKSQGTISLF
ncbi:fatty acid desaturase [Chloropicon primus]|uniref:Fatty acid desaturase n=2 Tax=Chloropicon primus TaxID=1764295 RepID=A0A5B8MVM0_9CHLO|nr:fatty acid desaturase [Chloropicon primus]UPR03666.1 fatty acid desaturase [Chloropicon primus]|eukprot:QDZ24457.1 fatty acid desaturase [Chloropicon primus]